MTNHLDCRWAETQPIASFEPDQCQVILDEDAEMWEIQDICPKCFGSTAATFPRNIQLPGPKAGRGQGAGLDVGIVSLAVQCNCGLEHAGRPAGVAGCGCRWVVEVNGALHR